MTFNTRDERNIDKRICSCFNVSDIIELKDSVV